MRLLTLVLAASLLVASCATAEPDPLDEALCVIYLQSYLWSDRGDDVKDRLRLLEQKNDADAIPECSGNDSAGHFINLLSSGYSHGMDDGWEAGRRGAALWLESDSCMQAVFRYAEFSDRPALFASAETLCPALAEKLMEPR